MVCGLVNAKNAFGGYAGKSVFNTLFIYESSAERKFRVIDLRLTDEDGRRPISESCKSVGIEF